MIEQPRPRSPLASVRPSTVDVERSQDMPIERLYPAGTALDLLERDRLIATVADRLRDGGKPLVVASSNLDQLTWFGSRSPLDDPALSRDGLDWIVAPDGMPIVWWAQHRAKHPVEQLAGSDLLPEMLERAAEDGTPVAFLGGWPEQHRLLSATLATRFPSLLIAGFWGPERDQLDEGRLQRQLAEEIAATGAGMLVVSLGKPRQEVWLDEHLLETGCRVGLAFGASTDFLGGTVPRAPTLLRRSGLEWLFRLLREPRRLWRRYLLQGPLALWQLLLRSPLSIRVIPPASTRGSFP